MGKDRFRRVRSMSGWGHVRQPIFALTLVLVGGCTLLPPAAGVREEVSGTYAGFLQVEGDLHGASLEVVQSNSSLSGHLTSGEGLSARGRGTINRSAIRLELRYDIECPGVMVLRGEAVEQGSRLVGEYVAEDCTGRTSGTFDLRR